MDLFITRRGGSGGISPQMIVTALPGSMITAVNGEETITGVVGAEGVLTMEPTALGTWTVTAALDGQQACSTIYIEEEYPVSLPYLIPFALSGARNETVTITEDGVQIGSAALDSTGNGTITLANVMGKTLTFTGSVSGYAVTVPVSSSEMTVNVHPDGALYWYGNEFSAVTGGWSGFNSFDNGNGYGMGTYWENTHSIYIANILGSHNAAGAAPVNKIDLTPYNSIKAYFTSTTNDVTLAASNSRNQSFESNAAARATTSNGSASLTINVSNLNSSYYVGLSVWGAGSTQYGGTFNRVVLEK